MTLDNQDKKLIESTIPKWLVPVLLTIGGATLSVGIWAGTVSNKVDEVERNQRINTPIINTQLVTLESIRTDVKWIRIEVEKQGYQIMEMKREMNTIKDSK